MLLQKCFSYPIVSSLNSTDVRKSSYSLLLFFQCTAVKLADLKYVNKQQHIMFVDNPV